MTRPSLSSLRALGQRPLAPPQTLPSGLLSLDRILPGGGIPRGRLSQFSGRPSSGKSALAAAFCARTIAAGRGAAWLDGAGGFYPLPALEQGLPLDRLLTVRPPAGDRRAVQRAAEILLEAGEALALLVIALPAGATLSARALARLRLAAESGRVALLFVQDVGPGAAPPGSLGSLVALHLIVRRVRVGANGAARLRVALAKSKLGGAGRQAMVDLDGPHGVRVDSTL